MTAKNITVRYFARFRDLAGCDQESVQTTASKTADLFAELSARFAIEEPMAHCKIAVNDTLADWQHRLEDGDTVLLFPPVAGG